MLSLVDLKRVLAAGPGQRIDVINAGNASAARIARALVALANSDGGLLLIPFDATRTHGKPDVTEVHNLALAATRLSVPALIVPLPYVVMDGELPAAMVIEVPDGLPHAYGLDDHYLARRDTKVVSLPARNLNALLLARTDGTWEAASPPGSSSADIHWKKAEAYVNSVPQLGIGDVQEALLLRGCGIKRGRQWRPTYAGLLLFGRQPQRWVKGSEVLAARFVGSEMNNAFAQQTIGGTLPDQLRKIEAFLAEHTPATSNLAASEFARKDHGPYPDGVLREAAVNAIAHRDYSLSGAQVHVLMFGDRIEVRSPGRLPGHVTLKNLVNERYSRNEAIVQVLADMGYIERLGYGIDRMLRVMKDTGHDAPKFEETDNGFSVTLPAKTPLAIASPAAATNPQYARMDKMLNHLRTVGRITNRDYAELCPDVSPESLRRDFVELVAKNLIMRVGDKRGTYYILK